jgi:tetratricopeptide (TPR) repeat protein
MHPCTRMLLQGIHIRGNLRFSVRLALSLIISLVVSSGVSAQNSDGGVAAQASAARQANDLPRAAALYRQALQQKPDWAEGWWDLGSVLYDANQYKEAADALAKAAELDRKAAPAWGLLGLCEFELGSFDKSLSHIQQSLTLGLPGQDQMEGVLRYHEALLLARVRNFDGALQTYSWFVKRGVHHDVFLTALGLAALRNTLFPEQVPPDQRDLYIAAGKAAFLSMSGNADAQQAFRDLTERYPTTPGVHYLYGSFLLSSNPEMAMSEMQRELEISPSNGAASAMLAWMLLEQDDFSSAAPLAASAVQDEPSLTMAQYVYGRVLVQRGQLAEGIEHLERAVKEAPALLMNHVALAAAYSKAGRPEDARRERILSVRLAKEEHAPSAP